MIVGFSGKMHSGKDTCAQMLIDHHNFSEGRVAGALKAMLWSMYEYAGVDSFEIEEKIYGKLREEPCELLGGNTPRHAMQTLGTEWGRYLIHENVWIDLEMARIKANHRTVFTDVRFNNEAHAIREAGGIVVLVERPNYEPPEQAATHSSEDGIDPKLIDHVIVNDGSLYDLQVKVSDWIVDQI